MQPNLSLEIRLSRAGDPLDPKALIGSTVSFPLNNRGVVCIADAFYIKHKVAVPGPQKVLPVYLSLFKYEALVVTAIPRVHLQMYPILSF